MRSDILSDLYGTDQQYHMINNLFVKKRKKNEEEEGKHQDDSVNGQNIIYQLHSLMLACYQFRARFDSVPPNFQSNLT